MGTEAADFKRDFFILHPRLYCVAFIMLGNSQDAEDIVQDFYCKLWNIRDELSEVKNAEAYCIRMLKNSCLDFIRTDKSNRTMEMDDSICSSSQNAESALLLREQIEEIDLLINQLPENQQTVIRLRAVEANSFVEIEKKTGLSEVNIRVLLSRARKSIKEKLGIQKNEK